MGQMNDSDRSRPRPDRRDRSALWFVLVCVVVIAIVWLAAGAHPVWFMGGTAPVGSEGP